MESMNCQYVQTAIDMDIRRGEVNETVGAHLNGCHDCRRYSDETAVLMTMLGAQPRIEAPADFDFKLRARIARAKAEPASAAGLFAKMQARFSGFSWGQAAAATATLAVAATFTALNFSDSDRAVKTKVDEARIVETAAASVEPPITNAPAMTNTMTNKPALSVKSKPRVSVVAHALAEERTKNISVESEFETEAGDYTWRGFDPDKGKIITTRNRDLIGAENSASTMSKTLSFVPSI